MTIDSGRPVFFHRRSFYRTVVGENGGGGTRLSVPSGWFGSPASGRGGAERGGGATRT